MQMETHMNLDARVRALEDRAAITELTAQYCWLLTRGDGRTVAENLYTQDGIFDRTAMNSGSIKGRKELIAFYTKSSARGAVIPLIHNHILQMNGDEAHGTCVVESRVAPDHATGAVNYYQDYYRRVDGSWRFAIRKVGSYYPQFREIPASNT
jgi:hypothetical protein